MDFACLKGIEEGVAEVASILHIEEDGYHTQLFSLNVLDIHSLMHQMDLQVVLLSSDQMFRGGMHMKLTQLELMRLVVPVNKD
jgi:hypothetical protein